LMFLSFVLQVTLPQRFTAFTGLGLLLTSLLGAIFFPLALSLSDDIHRRCDSAFEDHEVLTAEDALAVGESCRPRLHLRVRFSKSLKSKQTGTFKRNEHLVIRIVAGDQMLAFSKSQAITGWVTARRTDGTLLVKVSGSGRRGDPSCTASKFRYCGGSCRIDRLIRCLFSLLGAMRMHECGRRISLLWWRDLAFCWVGIIEMRLVQVILAVAALITIIVAAAIGVPPRDWAAPALFPPEHDMNAGLAMFDLFGAGPAPGEPPDSRDGFGPAPRNSRLCDLGMRDSSQRGCTMDRCKANTVVSPPPPGSCLCYHDTGRGCTSGNCSVVASFYGLDVLPSQVRDKEFWDVIKTMLPDQRFGTVLSPTALGRSLLMEDWESGSQTMSPMLRTALQSSDILGPSSLNQSVPVSECEGSCKPILCFCGQKPCRLTGVLSAGVWSPLATSGSRYITPGNLALQAQPNAAFGQDLSATAEIFVVWGLRTKSMPNAWIAKQLEFDPAFELADTSAQRDIYAFCAGLDPDLNVFSQNCWMSDFRDWLAARGERFPVQIASEFYERLALFFRNGPRADSKEGPRYYLWRTRGKKIIGMYASFQVTAASITGPDLQAYIGLWKTYVDKRAGIASIHANDMWVTSSLFSQLDAPSAAEDAYLGSIIPITTCGVLSIFVLTFSPGLSMAVMSVLMLFMAVMVSLVAKSRDRFDAVGAVQLISFCSLMASPLIRVSQQYSYALDGTGSKNATPKGPLKPMHQALGLENSGSMHSRGSALSRVSMEGLDFCVDYRIEVFPGAPNIERKARAATALVRAGFAASGSALVAFCGGVGLLACETSGFRRLGTAVFLSALAIPIAALIALPVLLLMGAAPTRSWHKAVGSLYRWSRERKTHEPDPKLQAAAADAGAMLGQPWDWVAPELEEQPKQKPTPLLAHARSVSTFQIIAENDEISLGPLQRFIARFRGRNAEN